MSAQLIARFKNITTDGAILEVVVWKVPAPVPPTEHGYKYRAVYVVDGIRIVGFDNERGKGDHCHLDGMEAPYMRIPRPFGHRFHAHPATQSTPIRPLIP